jgi:hypothetical protein
MSESPRSVKYRVVGVREDGKHVPLCVYLALETAERISTLARSEPTYAKIIIESNEGDVRRAQI